jgi:hypothetical protein
MNQQLSELRFDLALRSRWNLGFFWAGLVFWFYAAVVGWLYPLQTARLLWLIGTSFIFPVAILVSRLMRVDPFSKANPLGQLVGYTHMSVILMTLPLVVIAYLRYPEFMILVLAISTSLSYYVMSWAFGSSLFWLHAALRTAAVTLAWLAFPVAQSWLVPAIVAVAYGVTVALGPALRVRWLQAHSRGAAA